MGKIKRGGDDLQGSSHGNRRAKRAVRISKESRIGIGESIQNSGDLHEHSNKDILTELSDEVKSNLSKSVASIAVRNGDALLFACSGIAIGRHAYATRFATSPNLATVILNCTKYKNKNDNVKIEVRHEGSEVYEGFLAIDGVHDNFSVVKVKTFLDVNVGLVKHAEGILPYGKVVALGRGTSGELVAKRVTLAADVSRTGDKEDPVLSMAKITKVWDGGPLFSFDGNFVGMNLFLVMERAFFLPWGVMLYQVNNLTPLENKKDFPPSESMNEVRLGEEPTDEIINRYQDAYRADLEDLYGDIDSMGYPKLPITMLKYGMVLFNTFEQTFGEVWGEGVSRELGKNASDISRIVVALASFKGEKMFSACTGFFIRWNGSTTILTSASLVMAGNGGDDNKIVENLRTEVLLPNKLFRTGTLEHYSLHYNVALVSVEDARVVRPAKIQLDFSNLSRVAATGRCFRSGTLMAASGRLVSWSGRLDCKFIKRSTCKISKAGIGGPLFNMDGEVIGMNFYSEKIGTPFLLWEDIGNILAHFKEKSDAGEVAKDSGSSFWKMDGDGRVRLNRWPVPMACWRLPGNPWWRYPDELDDDAFLDAPDIEIPPGEEFKYGYIRGKRYRQLVKHFWIPWRS